MVGFLGSPILALTASATDEVVTDIFTQLRIEQPKVFRTQFSRDNLSYVVIHQEGKLEKIALPRGVVQERWPANKISSRFDGNSVFVVVNPEISAPIALDTTRVSHVEGEGLKIAPGVAIASGLEGSPVIEVATGMLFGLLLPDADGWMVAEF